MSDDAPHPGGGGYRDPPKHSQFGPDNPGNRSGRPKGSKNHKTVLREIAGEIHRLPFNGATKDRTNVELLFLKLGEKAQAGDLTCKKALDRLRGRYQRPEETTLETIGILLFEDMTEEEWALRIKAHLAREAYVAEHGEDDDEEDGPRCPPLPPP